MRCLGCVRCEDGPVVELVDGRKVCTDCEDWRLECEAREVLKMPTLEARRAYIQRVLGTRGMRTREKLENAIYFVWAKAKTKKA